ncbi:Ty3/gypsy retrotransposon protein [Abeliophyllum distichum]|uniref:Ty3/gypsy retrotransposon protein n=1 Tax=Abeliophyllum distichum TaxID=126358 RepID=A0ABD1V882_9LAMI
MLGRFCSSLVPMGIEKKQAAKLGGVQEASSRSFQIHPKRDHRREVLSSPELREEDDVMGKEEIGEPAAVGEIVELSLNSVVGLTAPQTMKLKGSILQQKVVVLLDCGATHNFILAKLVEKLGLPRTETAGYDVIMDTGLTV